MVSPKPPVKDIKKDVKSPVHEPKPADPKNTKSPGTAVKGGAVTKKTGKDHDDKDKHKD